MARTAKDALMDLNRLTLTFCAIGMAWTFSSVSFAADADMKSKPQPAHAEKIVDQLRKAIQSKDFTTLRTVAPIHDNEALHWWGCKSGPSKDVSVEFMLEKLMELSKGADVRINPTPE